MPYISNLGEKSLKPYSGMVIATQYDAVTSLRVRSSVIASLTRTPTIAGNRQTWTLSVWIKRGILGVVSTILHAYDGVSSRRSFIQFNADDTITWQQGGSATSGIVTTTATYRDPSAWYQFVFTADFSNATPASRASIYLNNVLQTVTTADDFDIADGFVNSTNQHQMANQGLTSNFFDGYLSDINFIDGLALSPSSFAVASITGQWKPNAYTGVYGTNGFKLVFPGQAEPTPTPISFLTPSSLRFRASASAYLSRTPSVASNRQVWTFSTWLKIGPSIGSDRYIFAAGAAAGGLLTGLTLTSTDRFDLFWNNNASSTTTAAVYRDYSAWYHVCLVANTTTLTLYVNNIQVAQRSISGNAEINNTSVHRIGSRADSASPGSYFDGYMDEVNFVDGSALTPSQFGRADSVTGQFLPIAYTGAYGTNGFYLPFRTLATLTNDLSGNGNNFSSSGISIASDATNDRVFDVVTPTSSTVANFAVFNPLERGPGVTISDGNLKYSSTTSTGTNGIVSMRITVGMKSFFEFTCGAAAATRTIAIGGAAYIGNTGVVSGGIGGTGTFATWTTADVIGCACDFNSRTVAFYKNGVLQTTVTGVSNTADWVINATQTTGLGEYTANFGQQAYRFTQPVGFLPLNTFNLPVPDVVRSNTQMDANVYTGTGAALSVIDPAGFQPDLVWIKSRSDATNHNIYDSIRGTTKALSSNTTDAETTLTGGVTAFNSNGFSLGSDGTVNTLGRTYVAWEWKAAGPGALNSLGTTTSNVSANTPSGFSVVSYTGAGTAATVGHGLLAAPSLIIVKNRDAATNWAVYHASLGATNVLQLNTTMGAQAVTGIWNNTEPNGTVFSVGNLIDTNLLSTNYIAYCFEPVPGYSAFGSYTGNGLSNGPFIYTGFRPRYFMWKRTDTAGSWFTVDESRSPFNTAALSLQLDTANMEASGFTMDLVSNGIKIQGDTTVGTNASGGAYIYAAFADAPFKYAGAR